jgi:hypothetical protein
MWRFIGMGLCAVLALQWRGLGAAIRFRKEATILFLSRTGGACSLLEMRTIYHGASRCVFIMRRQAPPARERQEI